MIKVHNAKAFNLLLFDIFLDHENLALLISKGEGEFIFQRGRDHRLHSIVSVISLLQFIFNKITRLLERTLF